MKHKILIMLFMATILIPAIVCSQSPADYLILQDINGYIFRTQTNDFFTGEPKTVPGYSTRGGAGILAGADHFNLDHTDTTYETDYINRDIRLDVEVKVTQHAGSDSDKWLLHELEKAFRDSDNEGGTLGQLHKGSRLTAIGTGKVYRYLGTYRWVSNNVVVVIDSSNFRKPEPLEVVQAYLQKIPSTIPSTLVLDKAHDEQWIKDEMDRRLWLCDKWFEQLQLVKVEQKQVLEEAVKSMNVFLDYREKYYGVKAGDEENMLQGYLAAKDGTNIRNKLSEYKTWWTANKSGSLIGILSIYTHRLWGNVSHVFKKVVVFLTALLKKLLGMLG